MDVALKVAIIKSGKRQWKIAQEAGLTESKLSKYLCGHGRLCEAELHRLYTVLAMDVEQELMAAREEQ